MAHGSMQGRCLVRQTSAAGSAAINKGPKALPKLCSPENPDCDGQMLRQEHCTERCAESTQVALPSRKSWGHIDLFFFIFFFLIRKTKEKRNTEPLLSALKTYPR